jgi:hypothetical protein
MMKCTAMMAKIRIKDSTNKFFLEETFVVISPPKLTLVANLVNVRVHCKWNTHDKTTSSSYFRMIRAMISNEYA